MGNTSVGVTNFSFFWKHPTVRKHKYLSKGWDRYMDERLIVEY